MLPKSIHLLIVLLQPTTRNSLMLFVMLLMSLKISQVNVTVVSVAPLRSQNSFSFIFSMNTCF
ncbi:hypothetical protein [Tenacibaculum bernardetii]|uniref:hypothetical protein n=1 Tax=Tenacibaculum bernardetii TaxID=3021375 RepID=UPI003B82EC50